MKAKLAPSPSPAEVRHISESGMVVGVCVEMRESAWVPGEAREGRQLGRLLGAKRTEASCSASAS
eukprot:2776173-Rhodomonas_salina.2